MKFSELPEKVQTARREALKKRKAAITNRRRESPTTRTPGTQGEFKKGKVNMVPDRVESIVLPEECSKLITAVRGHLKKNPVLLGSCTNFLSMGMRIGEATRWPIGLHTSFVEAWRNLIADDTFVRNIVEWHILTRTTAQVAFIATHVSLFAATEAWSMVWLAYTEVVKAQQESTDG